MTARLPIAGSIEHRDGHEVISWRYGAETIRHTSHWRYVGGQPSNVLLEFVALADASADEIVEFAKMYGPLELCPHDRPWTHPKGADVTQQRERPTSLEFAPPCFPMEYEYTYAWRGYARQMGALLRVGGSLRVGRRPTLRDWLEVAHNGAGMRPRPNAAGFCVACRVEAQKRGVTQKREWWVDAVGDTFSCEACLRDQIAGEIDGLRTELASELDRVLDEGNVRMMVQWPLDADHPQISVRGELYGSLAAQLVYEIAAAPGYAICSECLQPYTPKRQPKRGQKNYCPRCRRRGIPNRNTQRRLRAIRERAEGR